MAYDESPGAGALYRLDLDGTWATVLTGLTISNGIGWSPDGTTMYLADSGTGRIEAFDFDGGPGGISGRRSLVHVEQPGVVPRAHRRRLRGDLGGALGGGEIRRYAADGFLLATVPMPVQRPTSCAFGGPDCATPIRTTSHAGQNEVA